MRILLFLSLLLGLVAPAIAEKKVALVIGNSVYQNVPPLANPSNDADAIAESFIRLGFDVTLAKDINVNGLRLALSEFAVKSASADIAAIYYAGHGIEVDGQNFIIPVDAKLKNVVVVGFELISLDSIISSMQGSKGLKLVFLDACRDNPFRQSMSASSGTRSIGRGLATIEPDAGMVISYAAKAGTVAYDGDSEHSPYTTALLKNMEEPGLELQFLFRRVRDDVIRRTARRQEPFFYGSLPDRKFYLKPPAPVAEPVAAPVIAPVVQQEPRNSSESQDAADAWRFIQNTMDRGDIEAYLAEYGSANSFYARLAQKRLNALTGAFTGGDTATNRRVAAAPNAQTQPVEPARQPTLFVPQTPNVQSQPTTKLPLKTAALPTPTLSITSIGDIDPNISSRELARSMQTELNRVGCEAGNPDGKWGRNSRNALRRYSQNASIEIASANPSIELLRTLRNSNGRICPLVCRATEDLVSGECVRRTCSAGQQLSSGGSCYTPKKVNKRAACRAGQKRNTSGKCYTPATKRAKVKKRKSAPRRTKRRSKDPNVGRLPPAGSCIQNPPCRRDE